MSGGSPSAEWLRFTAQQIREAEFLDDAIDVQDAQKMEEIADEIDAIAYACRVLPAWAEGAA